MKLAEKLIAELCQFYSLFWLGAANAQDAKLIEAAKKEGGKVVVYGSLENDTMDLLSAAFKKKTGMEVDYWRDAADKVTDRVIAETRAGKPLDRCRADDDLDHASSDSKGRLVGEIRFAVGEMLFPKKSLHPNLGPALSQHGDRRGLSHWHHQTSGCAQIARRSGEAAIQGKVVIPDPSQHTTTAQWLASLHKIMGQGAC